MRRFVVAVLGLGLCVAGSMTAVAQQGSAPWDYEGKQGPLNWGRLDPAYRACSEGKEQSPIEIRGAHLNKNLKPIEFHYLSSSMTLVNTGHWIQVTPAPGSYIVANGTRYDLVQFHFHHPGEEAVKGALPDMTLDLVHRSAEGKIAVVAVRLNEGNPNAVLAALWEHMPKTAGATDKMTESMSPAGLLPADRGYWTYEGSLTAPPCTEGVQWFIFEQEVELSRSQLRTYAALFKVTSRMIQPTRGRKIEASE
jgi:carbonic anhydrase